MKPFLVTLSMTIASILASATAIAGSGKYYCTEKIDDYLNGPHERHHYLQIRSGNVYFWMDFNGKPETGNLDLRLRDPRLQDVGIGKITGTTKNGWAHVEGPGMLSPYEQKTYGKWFLGRELFLSKDILQDAPTGYLLVLTHRHDGRSKDPTRELAPTKAGMSCKAVN
jgi:hypothetical protein